jgi:hypothetical protein
MAVGEVPKEVGELRVAMFIDEVDNGVPLGSAAPAND